MLVTSACCLSFKLGCSPENDFPENFRGFAQTLEACEGIVVPLQSTPRELSPLTKHTITCSRAAHIFTNSPPFKKPDYLLLFITTVRHWNIRLYFTPLHFFKIHLNIILSFTVWSPKWTFVSFPTKTLLPFLISHLPDHDLPIPSSLTQSP